MPSTKAKSSKQSYQQLRDKLDTVLSELQREDLDIDKALEYYRRGLELVKQLEEYLNNAENKVQDIKTKLEAKNTAS
jgi:exodeoxyribonuclease VII small subunit